MCQKLRYFCQMEKFLVFRLTLRMFSFRCVVAKQLPFNRSGDWTEVFNRLKCGQYNLLLICRPTYKTLSIYFAHFVFPETERKYVLNAISYS